MSGRFEEQLAKRGLRHITVSGPHENRLAAAVAATDALLSTGWSFSTPLTP